jgi:hypothetical protein
MIRHHDGTNDSAQKISAQSKRGAIWAVQWSWRKHRIVLTRGEAEKAKRAWSAWKERLGWKKLGRYYLNPDTGKREVCNVVKYDPQTRKVIDSI